VYSFRLSNQIFRSRRKYINTRSARSSVERAAKAANVIACLEKKNTL